MCTDEFAGLQLPSDAGAGPTLAAAYELELWIGGATSHSSRAVAAVRKFADEILQGHCKLVVRDLYQERGAQPNEQIVVLPLLVRMQPLPQKCISGDLTNHARLRKELSLDRRAAARTEEPQA